VPEAGTGIGRILMVVGAAAFLVGALLAAGVKIPLGRLPGDIVIRREGGTFYLPIMTCLLLSGLLSLVAWFFRR
jgi:Protein of unknown function (DUF2905)